MGAHLDTIRFSVLLFPAVALLLALPVFVIHRRWFGEVREYRAAVFYAFSFYFITACLLTVLPLPHDTAAFCERLAGYAHTQLVPFGSFAEIFAYAGRHHLGWSLQDLADNKALWQIVFNFALLAPFGFFLRALYGAGFVATVGIALAFSLFLETTQLTGVWGLADCPYRVFDVDDLITNTAGAAIGWMALRLFYWLPKP